MTLITIYILCHNRPIDAERCIRSVLGQTDQNFTLIVSDNSSNDEVETKVREKFPDIQFLRRKPMLPALEHFNKCIDEVSSGHFCLFHDDDLMMPDFIKQTRLAIEYFPNAIAIGSNAYIETNGQPHSKASFASTVGHEVIDSARELAKRYFGRYQSGIAPFPGYMYRRDVIAALRFNPEEGKYSDVTWLLRLAERGRIVWINIPLMTYRIHGKNDGLIESRRDRLRFLAYLKHHIHIYRRSLLSDYRYGFIYKNISRSIDSTHKNRFSISKKFLRQYRWMRLIHLENWISLIKRAYIKKVTP